jgi:hypothetical protein
VNHLKNKSVLTNDYFLFMYTSDSGGKMIELQNR